MYWGKVWTRHEKKSDHHKRRLVEKESYRWIKTAQTARNVLSEAAMITVIGDREEDFFGAWAHVPADRVHLLTRLMNDHAVVGGGTVRRQAGSVAFADCRTVELRARATRKARKATLALRFGTAVLKRPKNTPDRDLPASVHMKDARNGIPTPVLLAKVVDKLDHVDMQDRDTKGDVYEYMLGKIATAGQNGQFRTPRHIIALMVELVAPTPKDTICDPAIGTAGFLVAAGEYLRRNHPEIFRDAKLRKHFHETMFTGYDFDSTMLRIAAMNMVLHGIENADIHYRDSLSEDHSGDEARYSVVLANPPFSGSLDYEQCAKDLQQIVKTKKTELLFLALFLRLLKVGGRAAVIVPNGVLFGSSNAHKTLRKILVEEHKLEAAIKLPSGVFRPYAGGLDGHSRLRQDGRRWHGSCLVLRRAGRRVVARRQAAGTVAGGETRPNTGGEAEHRRSNKEQPPGCRVTLEEARGGRDETSSHRAKFLRAES
jgi:hypothetical protein